LAADIALTLPAQGRRLGFPEPRRAVLAADFHHLAGDGDLDRFTLEGAIAGGTASFGHDRFPSSFGFDEEKNHRAAKGRYQDL
jgi:hypothetical protein